MNTAWPSLSDG